MIARAQKLITACNWIFLGLFGFLVILSFVGVDTESALGSIVSLIALSGILWLPLAALVSVAGVVLRYKVAGSMLKLCTDPAIYVLFMVFYVFVLIFSQGPTV